MAYLEYRPRETLFQYTSVDGLRGILQSKKLRLSDLREANDPRELDLGYEKIIEALKELLLAEPPGPKSELLSHLIDRLAVYFQTAHVFCSCFSSAVDELPMWAAYGQNYSGLAVGFRPSAILAIPARVQKVRYLEGAREDDAAKLLALKVADQVELYIQSKEVEPWIGAAVDAITAATALKGNKWTYEKEVRLIYIQRKERPKGIAGKMPVGVIAKDDFVYWREPSQRTVGNRKISYVEFDFGKYRDGKWDPSRAIKTVTVGPNCPLSVADVESLLEDGGYRDCVVEKSGCQIRI